MSFTLKSFRGWMMSDGHHTLDYLLINLFSQFWLLEIPLKTSKYWCIKMMCDGIIIPFSPFVSVRQQLMSQSLSKPHPFSPYITACISIHLKYPVQSITCTCDMYSCHSTPVTCRDRSSNLTDVDGICTLPDCCTASLVLTSKVKTITGRWVWLSLMDCNWHD